MVFVNVRRSVRRKVDLTDHARVTVHRDVIVRNTLGCPDRSGAVSWFPERTNAVDLEHPGFLTVCQSYTLTEITGFSVTVLFCKSAHENYCISRIVGSLKREGLELLDRHDRVRAVCCCSGSALSSLTHQKTFFIAKWIGVQEILVGVLDLGDFAQLYERHPIGIDYPFPDRSHTPRFMVCRGDDQYP